MTLTLFLGWVLVLLPVLAIPFSHTKADALPAYLPALLIFLILFMLDKLGYMKRFTLSGLYIAFDMLFLLSIYLSVVHSPHMRATILLGGFVVMPLSFIAYSGGLER